MSVLEIVLLIIGIIVFVISFLVGSKSGETKGGNEYELTEKELDRLLEEKIKDAEEKLSDKVDETVEYSAGKAERNMERLTNEKIMAITEYADTVLGDIHKNHEEVVFLYDMLNDKQTNLKNTVREVEVVAKSAKDTVSKAKEAAQEALQETPFVPFMIEGNEQEQTTTIKKKKKADSLAARKDPIQAPVSEEATVIPEMISIGEESEGGNKNEQILSLHKAGKSNMAIAKELGMGVGEVKLVIDLFKGM